MRCIPDHDPGIGLEINGLPRGVRDGIIEHVFEFPGMPLIVDISGNDDPAPEGGMLLEYFIIYANFRHGFSSEISLKSFDSIDIV